MQEYTFVLCKLPSRLHYLSAIIFTDDFYRKIWRKKFTAENNEDAVAKGRAIFNSSHKKWLTGWILPPSPKLEKNIEELSEAEATAWLKKNEPIMDFFRM